jgi:protein-tyrosine-phosphatase
MTLHLVQVLLPLKPGMKRVVVVDGDAAFLTAAYLRRRVGQNVHVTYVGVDGEAVDTRILQVLKEEGVEVDGSEAALVDLHRGEPFDVVITMSENARRRTPLIPGTHRIHWSLSEMHEPGAPKRNLEEVYHLRNEVKFQSERLASELRAALFTEGRDKKQKDL